MINIVSMVNFILFFALIFLVFYLPGRGLLRLSRISADKFTHIFGVSIVTGICLFLFITYFLSWFQIAFLSNILIFLGLILELRFTLKEFKKNMNLSKILAPEIILIILGSIGMVYLTWPSGRLQNGELLFYANFRDSFYHLALIGSLTNHFPPFHPGLADVPLRGYNFFYDFLISNFAKFYSFNPMDLFFRYFPLLISILYGLTSLALAGFLKWKKVTMLLFISLMYFIQSFDFFANYIYKSFNYFYNSVGIIQSLENILNPSIIISVSFIFTAFILLFSKRTRWSFIVSILVISLIPQLKIYSGAIFYVGLFSIAIMEILKKRDFYFSEVLVLSTALAALMYLPLNYGSGGLIFAPLLIYKNFIDSAWIFNNLHWNVNYVIFLNHKNYVHIAYFYFVAVLIYFLTSLGIRVLALLNLRKIFQKEFYTPKNTFWLFCILSSFLIPSFFIQAVSVFSVIQFFWIGYIIILIPTALAIGSRLERVGKNRLIYSAIVLLILFIPGVARELITSVDNPFIVNSKLINASGMLNEINPNEGIVITNLTRVKNEYKDTYSFPIFSALSRHKIYYEPELTDFRDTSNIISQRKKTIQAIEENILNCNDPLISEDNVAKIMEKIGNKYLFILKRNECSDKFDKFRTIYKDEDSVIYKI